MIENYLKIAIAVLLRRKFLTFVNHFGTVLTLTTRARRRRSSSSATSSTRTCSAIRSTCRRS